MAISRLFAIALFHVFALSQSCYYPNGDAVTSEPVSPCTNSSSGAMCCPLNWACLSNGLCEDPAEGILGRYSCTDKDWDSADCPTFCTKNLSSSAGNQAVLQCADGSYCCDGNRSFNCCAADPGVFFTLPSATPVATITSASLPVSVPSASGDETPGGIPGTDSTSLPVPAQTETRAFNPFTTSNSDPDDLDGHGRSHKWPGWRDRLSDNQRVGLILGVIVGVLGGMLFMCACHFLWRRYRKHLQNSLAGSYPPSPSASKRHLNHGKTRSRLFPFSIWRGRGSGAIMVAQRQQTAPYELPANPLSAVPGCVELRSDEDATVHDSLEDIATSSSSPATSGPSFPLSPMSPTSNTSINNIQTRFGSHGGGSNGQVSPNSCSTCQDDASNVEHAVYAVGSRGQLVSHPSRPSMRPIPDQIATPQDQIGLQGNVNSEISKELEIQEEQNTPESVSRVVYQDPEKAVELPA